MQKYFLRIAACLAFFLACFASPSSVAKREKAAVGALKTDFVSQKNYVSVESLNKLAPKLMDAIREVMMLKDDSIELWTPYERQHFVESGNELRDLPPRFSLGTISGDSNGNVLRLTFYDEYSPQGVGQIFFYLKPIENPLAEEPGMESFANEGLSGNLERLVRNNVITHILPGDGAFKEVFLDADMNQTELEDRVRLSIVGIVTLDPWLRSDNEDLRKSFQDPTELPMSKPQARSLTFLVKLLKEGRLGNAGLVGLTPRPDIKAEELGAVIQMPTGGGKTEVGIRFHETLQKQGYRPRVVWIEPELPLLGQSQRRWNKRLGEENFASVMWDGASMSSKKRQELVSSGQAQNIFLSIDSLDSDPSKALFEEWMTNHSDPIEIYADECDAYGATNRGNALAWIASKFASRIIAKVGFSATPFHYIDGPIAQTKFGKNILFFGLSENEVDPVTNIPFITTLAQLRRAMNAGYLTPTIFFPYNHPEIATLKGDDAAYSDEDMATLLGIMEQFGTRQWLAFHTKGQTEQDGQSARAIQFSRYIKQHSKLFNAAALTGQTKGSKAQNQLIEDFEDQENGVLSLVQMGGRGLDIPSVTAELIATEMNSTNRLAQTIGRVVRKAPGKYYALAIDVTGENFQKLNGDLTHVFQVDPQRQKRVSNAINMGNAQGWDLTTKREFLDAIMLSPSDAGVSRAHFQDLVNQTIESMDAWEFYINIDARHEYGLDALPGQPNTNESVLQYLRRNAEIFRHPADGKPSLIQMPFSSVYYQWE